MPTCIIFMKGGEVEVNIYDASGKLVNRTEVKAVKFLEVVKAVSGFTVVNSPLDRTTMLVCEVSEGSVDVKGGTVGVK